MSKLVSGLIAITALAVGMASPDAYAQREPAPALLPLNVVVHDPAGHPLRGAHVRLESERGGDRLAVSDSAGVVSITGVPAGSTRVRVSHVGFALLDTTLALPPATAVRHVRLVLNPRTAALPAVAVEAAAPPSYNARRQEGSGFEERRRTGTGVFFTADELQRRGVRRITDAFRYVPGMRITTRHLVEALESTRQPGCPVAVYLDGTRLQAGSTFIGSIPFESVLAMEVYRGISEIPPAFRPLDRTCGAVLVWTRITVVR